MATVVSSASTDFGRVNPEVFPKHFLEEFHEYKKLLILYEKRFEQFPDSEMRETLFKQAIKIVSENLE